MEETTAPPSAREPGQMRRPLRPPMTFHGRGALQRLIGAFGRRSSTKPLPPGFRRARRGFDAPPAKPSPIVADEYHAGPNARFVQDGKPRLPAGSSGASRGTERGHGARGTGARGKEHKAAGLGIASHRPSGMSARSAPSGACAASARGRGSTRPVPGHASDAIAVTASRRQAAGPAGAGRPAGITAPPVPRDGCGRGPARRHCWPPAPARPRPWPPGGSRRCGRPRGP